MLSIFRRACILAKIAFVVSVHSSARMNQLGSHCTYFREILVLEILFKFFFRKYKIPYNLTRYRQFYMKIYAGLLFPLTLDRCESVLFESSGITHYAKRPHNITLHEHCLACSLFIQRGVKKGIINFYFQILKYTILEDYFS